MDSDPLQNVYFCPSTDTKPVHKVDPSLNVVSRCVNCGSDVSNKRRHNLSLGEVESIIRQWIAPLIVEEGNILCHPCWTAALHESSNQEPICNPDRLVCIICRCSLLRRRSHILRTDTEREIAIRKYVIELIKPHQVRGTSCICHPCWQRCDRKARRSSNSVNETNSESSITLPNITRASTTQAHCFFPECLATERLIVPKSLRVRIFKEYKYYIPTTSRICSFHLNNDNWQLLETVEAPIHTFNAQQIEDFATFVHESEPTLDFNNIEEMSNELVRYWIGMSKHQFKALSDAVPTLENIKNGRLGLAAYLIKLRTGDSDARLSTLLNIPRTTLTRYLANARNMLREIPTHNGDS